MENFWKLEGDTGRLILKDSEDVVETENDESTMYIGVRYGTMEELKFPDMYSAYKFMESVTCADKGAEFKVRFVYEGNSND